MKRKAKIKGKLLFFALVSSLLLCGSSYTYRKDHSKIEPRKQTGLKGDPILDDTTIQSYYSSVNLESTSSSLLNALHTLNSSKRTKTVGYRNMGTYYPKTDGDPSNSSNLILFYSGSSAKFSGSFSGNINREHVWPNSRGGGNVEDDIHMPRPTLTTENGSRGSSFYVEGKKTNNNTGWDPAMESFGVEKYRGIAARIIFYCAIADTSLTLIDKTTDSANNKTMGKLSDLLKWNLEYEVDSTETQRNDAAQDIQGNRNPFIDDRSLACKIWGNTNTTTQAVCSSYTEEATPTSLTLKAGSTSIGEGGTTELEVTSLPLGSSNSVKFTSSNESVATVSSKGVVTAISAGDTVITATSTFDETVKATITIHVKKVNSISVSETPNKTTYVEGDTFDLSGLTITALYDDGTSEVVNPSDCYTLDGVTGLQTLSIGTTSVYIWYGTNYVLYEGIEVTEAPAIESYRIEFQSNGADESSALSTSSIANQVTSGSEYIDSFADVSNVYSGKNGLKLSSSSKNGSFTINLSSLGKVKAKTLKLGLAAYKNDAATITINNQTITCSSSTSVTEHEVSLDGSELDALTISSSGRCYLSYVEVGGEASETPSVSFTSLSKEGTLAKTIYKYGESFDPAGLTIYANYSDDTKKDVTSEVQWSSLSLKSTSVTGSYTEDNVTKTIEIDGLSVIDDTTGEETFEITPLPTEKGEEAWTLVEDDTTLQVGDKLVLAENTQGKVASSLSGAFLSSVDATFSSDKKTMDANGEELIFTLGGESGAWTLSNSDDELLGATGNKKVAFGNGTTTWAISIDSDAKATIQNATSGNGRFLYNVQSPRFTTYTSNTSATMLLIQLYRFEAGTTTTYTEVGQLMKDIQDADFCSDYSLANGFLTRYQNLSDEDKAFFESAIISTDGTTYLERLNFFANKAKQNQLTSYNFVSNEHQDLYIILFIVGMGMVSIIIYAYILKKKSYQ